MLVFDNLREIQTTDYDSRRTGERFLDTGSTPVQSTLSHKEGPARRVGGYLMTRKRHLQTKVCKVSFEIKATALYVNRVIYSVVIFMV